MQLLDQLAAAARVGAVELDVHHRFAAALVAAQRLDRQQLAVLVALDAHDRVEQAVDGQLACGDRVGDRIDQERHVVVDDRDPHAPPAGFAAGRFDCDGDLAALPLGRDRGEEFRRFALGRRAQTVGFAGQRILRQRLANATIRVGLARRVWAVMKSIGSADVAMRAGL